jgi:hypothetical protein
LVAGAGLSAARPKPAASARGGKSRWRPRPHDQGQELSHTRTADRCRRVSGAPARRAAGRLDRPRRWSERRMNRLRVDHFPSGVLDQYPSGARRLAAAHPARASRLRRYRPACSWARVSASFEPPAVVLGRVLHCERIEPRSANSKSVWVPAGGGALFDEPRFTVAELRK